MTRRNAIILALVVLGTIAVPVAAFFAMYEKVEKEVYKPPAGEARINPMLGLERFLEADGWEVTTELTTAEPVADDTMMFIAGDISNYGPEQIEAWRSWVEEGGHLIISEPPPDLRRRDDMLHAFGFGEPPEVEKESLEDVLEGEPSPEALADEPKEAPKQSQEGETAAEAEEDGDAEDDGEAAASDETERSDEAGSDEAAGSDKASGSDEKLEKEPRWGKPAKVREGTVQMELVADCPSSRLDATLDVIDRVWLGKNGCLVALSRPMESGRITVVPRPRTFSNEKLGNFQHAKLAHDIFWQATGRSAHEARISLYGKRISWIGYLWGFFWPTGVSLLIVLLFALMAGSRRFGPLVAPVETARRRRTEHVIAMGRFLWKHDAQDALLAASQEALLHDVARGTVPAKMSIDEKSKWLAERTGIKVEEARRLLAEHAPTSPQHFADIIKQIEDLRRR
jgi:hypothetical protein